MTEFYQSVKDDLAKIVTDEVIYFGKTVKVKLFESIDDPSIVNKSGGYVPMYAIANEDDFIGIEVGQIMKINDIDFTIYAYRKTIYGSLIINIKQASGK